ncbi:MAG: FAD binding domain-containing protein [Vicinamibacterales bacterium]
MTPFDLREPRSLPEALALLDPHDPAVRPIAGGTALMLMMKTGVFRPGRLVSLRLIARQYAQIAATAEGEIRIGAMATLTDLARSSIVRRDLPVVADALPALSNVRVRNVATLGGHLAHADPHTDLPPVLIALGARVVATGPAGERTIAAEDLVSGYYETVLAGNELITDVRLPAQGARRAAYLKWTTSSADDWPAVGVAIALDVDADLVRDARIVVSAATEKPTRLTSAEGVVRGGRVDEALLRRAGEAAFEQVDTVSDARGSAAYKRDLVRVLVARGIRQCMAKA